MIARTLLAAACLASLAATAQRPDCPKADAAPPTAPIGPPPSFTPPFNPPPTFPATPEEMKASMPPSQVRELTPAELGADATRVQRDVEQRRANNWLLDVDEGHVSALLFMEKRMRADAFPAGSEVAVDISRTPLATWRYVGYFPTGMKSRAHRMFRSADGSLLSLEEWNYKADGGAIFNSPGMVNRKVAGHPATMVGIRGPSGCVESHLSWWNDHKEYQLEIVGPLDVEAQRALLVQVAEAIAAQ